jgi:hypothetical protein
MELIPVPGEAARQDLSGGIWPAWVATALYLISCGGNPALWAAYQDREKYLSRSNYQNLMSKTKQ